MVNTTGIIVGRLSPEEMCKIIISSDDKLIRTKFIELLYWYYSQGKLEEFVISEYLQ